jgi:hypothetical protein
MAVAYYLSNVFSMLLSPSACSGLQQHLIFQDKVASQPRGLFLQSPQRTV